MRTLFAFLFLVVCISAIGQDSKSKESFYLLTKEWKGTRDREKAEYLVRVVKVNDHSWKYDVYRYYGPLLYTQHFKDAEAKEPDSLQTYYHPSGYIDSTGNLVNNQLQGDWTYYNDTGRLIFKKSYDGGKLLSVKDYLREADTLKMPEVKVLNNEEESSFPGGARAWQRYLIKNMTYPERASQAKIAGVVIVRFVIDKNGRIESTIVFKSVEYSLDEAALTIIRNSPDWKPSTLDGVKVKSYKHQPLTYKF